MKKVIGESKYGEIIMAEMDDNIIKSLSSGHIEHPSNTYDGNTYFTCGSWGGDYTDIKGNVFSRGMKLAKDFDPAFDDIESKQIMLKEDYYEGDGSWCSSCGVYHDTEQYYDLSFTITEDGELYCKTCVEAEDLLITVNDPSDIFRSKDLTGCDDLEGFEEVETLFCDSSGMGGSGERAMTKDQAENTVKDLLEKYTELYAGLTGIGQFQVYVTLYKKVA